MKQIISALRRRGSNKGSNKDKESLTKAAANAANWPLTPSDSETSGNVIMSNRFGSNANQNNPTSAEVEYFGKVLSTQELEHARRKEDDARPRTPTRISSRYESKDRGLDRYSNGIDKGANSPKGVDEFDVEGIGKTFKHCDSVQMINSPNSSRRSSHGGDACADMSCSLFEFDNDTQTKQPSSLLDEEATSMNVSEFSANYVEDLTALGSSTMDGNTSTATSYLFELADDSNRQRRKYQFGVGQISKSSLRPKELLQDATTRHSTNKKPTSCRASARKVQFHRRNNPNADSEIAIASDDAGCLDEILEELSGTYLDAKSAFKQVLYAFVVSPDDIDQISDTLSDAKIELMELCYDITGKKK
ncbi:hypothetical protein ACHAXA_001553 [Cyclostephanos tholiformis]|uniref:Uncharacterized protein n=1 Tax=Cyclostephanos tholiformis TaxID=382380 RepID=A0ABD3RID0_9STRA